MITITDIAFVRYQVTDLDRMESFLTDFGLHRSSRTSEALYMRAAGPEHHVHISQLGSENKTLGFGLTVAKVEDLEHLAKHLGLAVEVNPEPGAGLRVRFTDPAGFLVDVIHGQQKLNNLPVRHPIEMNFAQSRKRLGAVIRHKPQQSSVLRLGHVALLVDNFANTVKFYEEVLGFRPSDTYWAGTEDNTIAAFMHCGLGSKWTDHHTLGLISAQDGKSRFDHSAFEVLDLDDLMHGNEYLKACGHKHSWGIGRHIQGSQLFDYWRDPFGNKIEHWTDGDLVNDSTPVGKAAISGDELSQWAPPLNPEFFQ